MKEISKIIINYIGIESLKSETEIKIKNWAKNVKAEEIKLNVPQYIINRLNLTKGSGQ